MLGTQFIRQEWATGANDPKHGRHNLLGQRNWPERGALTQRNPHYRTQI